MAAIGCDRPASTGMQRQGQRPEAVGVAVLAAFGGKADVPLLGVVTFGHRAQVGADGRVVGNAQLAVFHRAAYRVGQRFLDRSGERDALDARFAELALGIVRPADAEAGVVEAGARAPAPATAR